MIRAIRSVLQRNLIVGVALLALNSPVLGNTWIVDQNNGPGTNFTSIPPAIAAAAPGDVIIVRQGNYGSFVLSRGITMIGQGAVKISSSVFGVPAGEISAVPAGEVAVLYNIKQLYYSGRLRVDACAGTVLLQSMDGLIQIDACIDVRLLNVATLAGVYSSNSRLQISQSNLNGRHGLAADCFNPGEDGGCGVGVSGTGRIHLALSTAIGGDGGAGFPLCVQPGGSAGSGLGAIGSSSANPLDVILTGPGLLAGGSGNGNGDSLQLFSANAWSSNMGYQTAPVVGGGSTLTYLPAEPTLEMIGTPTPGGMITLRLHGAPGAVVRLNVGRSPIVQPVPGILVEALVLKERSFDRGTVPPSGVIDTPWSFQTTAPQGKLLIFQARLVDPSTGLAQRSNSIEAVVP